MREREKKKFFENINVCCNKIHQTHNNIVNQITIQWMCIRFIVAWKSCNNSNFVVVHRLIDFDLTLIFGKLSFVLMLLHYDFAFCISVSLFSRISMFYPSHYCVFAYSVSCCRAHSFIHLFSCSRQLSMSFPSLSLSLALPHLTNECKWKSESNDNEVKPTHNV